MVFLAYKLEFYEMHASVDIDVANYGNSQSYGVRY